MAEAIILNIESILTLLNESIQNPAQFVEPQIKKSQRFKQFTRLLYDFKSKLKEESLSKCLPQLITKGFDEEGIWQQIELQNKSAENHCEHQVQKFVTSDSKQDHESKEVEDDDNDSEDIHSPDDEEYAFDDDSGEDSDAPFEGEEEEEMPKRKIKSTKVEETEVDDQFFQLRKMEEFLNLEDMKEMRKDELSSTDESDDIDMFADIPSEDDLIEDEENEKLAESHKELMYGDFFDQPGDEGDCDNFDDPDSDRVLLNKDYDTRDYDPTLDKNSHKMQDEVEDNEEEEDEMNVEVPVPLTPFEKQQEKERKKIEKMEESMLQPKPWQLTGEVAASKRPENSLIHQPLMFDSNAKQDLLSTDELTSRIEQIVKNAIMNKAFNDVERKIKPVEDPRSYRKPIELDTNKSKKGLAEVYEEEYLKLHNKTEDTQEDPKHVEIKNLMDLLMPELQALFAFIPKPPIPEIKVVNNMPAITVEEVGPVALSDAAMLAPEEVKKKPKGALKNKDERSETDRKRERRKKKIYQKLKQKKLMELIASRPDMAKKHEKLLALKKLKQSRNTQIVKNDSVKIKSSRDFFTRLQDKVDVSKSQKTGEKKKKSVKTK